jgi:transposase
MQKKYIVTLSEAEREQLREIIKTGKTTARRVMRAHILLHADEGASDAVIARSLHVGQRTVERTRQKFVEGNLQFALSERPRPGGKRLLDAKQEAFLIATACANPPDGQVRWTMQLLADELIALQIVETISDETVRRTLKKTC